MLSPTRTLGIIALAGAMMLTAACAGSEDKPAAAATPDPTLHPSSVPTMPDPVSETTAAAPLPLGEALLGTAEMPGLNKQWTWAAGKTGPAGSEPFGPCARFSLLDIGATEVLQRSYLDPGDSDDSAAEQVADFADRMTTLRAQKTLAAWHRTCRKQITGATNVMIGPDTPVPTAAGDAGWYLVSSAPKGAETGQFNAFGYVVDGTRIALLRMDNEGQDYNYPPGAEPMVAAVKAAADRLS